MGILEHIPATPPRQDPPRTTIPVLRAGHHILKYDDIALFRFREVEVQCDWIRILPTHAVIVFADGVRVTPDEDIDIWTDLAVTGPANRFAPTFAPGAGGALDALYRPAVSFTIRKPVRRLSFVASDDVADYQVAEVPGDVHLFLGSGGCVDLDFGMPISHVVALDADFNGVLATFSPIRPALHGNDATAPTSGLIYVPSRTVVDSIALFIQWTGAAGAVSRVSLLQQGQAANSFELWRARPGGAALPLLATGGSATTVAPEHPIEVPTYQTRKFNAGDERGSLVLEVETTQLASAMNAGISCRSWM